MQCAMIAKSLSQSGETESGDANTRVTVKWIVVRRLVAL